jgi:uncharacterized protein
MTMPPQQNPYGQPQPMNPSDEKMWATLIHIGGIFLGFWAPLVGYIVLKDRGPFIRQHTTTALNFHITMAIGLAIGGVLSFFGIGLLLIVAVYVLILIFAIMAAMAANNGQYYRYPVAFDFVN